MKEYKVSDLFYTRWEDLRGPVQAEVLGLLMKMRETELGTTDYGYILIQLLRRIRRRPRLVQKLNVEQAVDIFNSLAFLNEPWYFFPEIKGSGLVRPDDKLARHTFDHFIYADNEYSSYIALNDELHLKRLVATLYQASFDKEAVESIAGSLKKIQEWQLFLVFYTYANVREFVSKRCKTLLPPAGKASDEDQEKHRPTGAMWLKLKHRLSETPAFQGYETAGRANMYAALDYLEDLAQIKENAKP